MSKGTVMQSLERRGEGESRLNRKLGINGSISVGRTTFFQSDIDH